MSPESIPTPAPSVNKETKDFWSATAEGKLMLRHCEDCGSFIWYPRHICPECSSMNTTWHESSGRGQIYSYSVNYRPEGAYRGNVDYLVLAYVQLEEGPRIMTNIVEAEPSSISVGMPVEVVFHDTGEGSSLYRFRPAR